MDLNLDSLKQEILDQLAAEEFTVFRAKPGGSEDVPVLMWDVERHPEFQGFLNAAKSVNSRLICFATRDFTMEQIEEAQYLLESSALARDEVRSIAKGLEELKVFTGLTASVELSFHYQGLMYVFEAIADWYETYLNLTDAIESSDYLGGEDDEEDEEGPLGGYYSKN